MAKTIKESTLRTLIRNMIREENAYQKFFSKALEKFGAKSPADLGDEKKKAFFNYVDKEWKGSNESD